MLKVIIILIVIVAVVYGLVIRKPPTEPSPNKSEITSPNLTLIPVKNGRDITNAEIKQITSNGIIFQADQGLIQARFQDLPPEFLSFYGKGAKAPTGVQKRAPISPSYQSQPQTTIQHIEPVISGIEDEAERVRRKAALASQMKSRQAIMDRYSKQSSFKKTSDKDYVSTEQYELAKIEYERFNQEYQSLR